MTGHGGAIYFGLDSENDGEAAREDTCPIEFVPGRVQVK